ncbi:MAG: hypothetical protein QOD81_35 [Solirubrobacteraceae bacterium]|nr:hypothetical protein [Solirubrobacteraceae bacterium]
MALDRQSIARHDFPTVRRGYDAAAVDAHLGAIADEVDELRRRAGPGAALATQSSEQVRAIVEAAERSAEAIRDAASADADQHVARVAAAADRLRERIDALERALGELVGGLRSEAERLRAEIAGVAAGATGLWPGGADDGAPAVAPSALGVTLGATARAVEEDEVGEEPALAAVGAAPAEDGPRSTDVVGARIEALEMAMSGLPREETDRLLAEQYDLPDRAGLLDGVYTRAQG